MSDVSTVITITPKAAQEIKSVMEKHGKPDCNLRIYVAGGGCSGFQYGMQLSSQVEEGDHVLEAHGIKVVVDAMSIQHLNGAMVDWDLLGGGFRIENPNAVSSCGCGQSFQTKDQEAPAKSGGCGSGCGSK